LRTIHPTFALVPGTRFGRISKVVDQVFELNTVITLPIEIVNETNLSENGIFYIS
jgi:hypothetical protein